MTGEISPETLSAVDKARRLLLKSWMGTAVTNSLKKHPGDPAAQIASLRLSRRWNERRLEEAEAVMSGYGSGARMASPEGDVWIAKQVAAIGFREGHLTSYISVGANCHYKNLETGETIDLGVIPEDGFTDEELQASIAELPVEDGSVGLPAGPIDYRVLA